jgi:DNA polymerase-1
VLASLIGNTRVIRLKRDWTEPSVVWTAIVGDSGSLKSPAAKLVLGPLFRLQRQLLKEYKALLGQYQEERADYDKRKRAFQKGEGGDPGDPPEEPTCPRLVCSDITIERLAEILEDNRRGTLLFRDELSGWFNSFTRYKGKAGGSDLPNWLEMFRAETIIVDRKTGERRTLFIPRAAVSLTGGIQPGTLARAMTAEFREAGLAARLGMAMPPKLRKHWSEVEVDPAVRESYEKTLAALRALDFDRDDDGEPAPFALRLSPEAKQVWVRFYDDWAGHQAEAEGDLAASYSKIEACAARFALLHHVVTHAPAGEDCDPVGPESVEAGVALARWFAAETRRIYGMLGESDQDRQVRRLVEFIRVQGGSITARALQRSSPTRYRTPQQAEEALDVLVKADLADWRDCPPGPKGGRPTRACVLRSPESTHDKTDETDGTPPPWEGPDPGPAPTEPWQNSDGTCSDTQNPNGSRGFVGFVNRQCESNLAPDPSAAGGPGISSVNEVLSTQGAEPGAVDLPGGTLIRDAAELPAVLQAVEESKAVAMDCETTGLDPRRDQVRLLTLATDCGTWLLDLFAVPPAALGEQLFPLLAERTVLGHNLGFDLGFLGGLGFEPGPVADTMLLSQLLHGTRHARGFHGLGECVQRELGRELSKDLQKSDWSGQLSAEQLEYAVRDVAVLAPLHTRLQGQVKAAGLERVAHIECRCLPAVVWLSRSGVALDAAAWKALAAEAAAMVERLAQELDALAPRPAQGEMFTAGWNWDSPEQVKAAFRALGINLASTEDEALAALTHPLAGLLRQYRAAAKKVSTYGADWLSHLAPDGRVYAGWRQLGADSGRMACRSPNLQNLPRAGRYRACFVAPPGRLLVKADYSQIELRIAAKVTNERAMLEAYGKGEDLHTRTARLLLGKEDVTREDRQVAKSANFGLLYGMGAKRYREYAATNYGLQLSEEQAADYRRLFFEAYPGLARWHRDTGRTGDRAVETRTLTGRRRAGVTRFAEKLNTPVQGTGADGLKRALALLWERRGDCPGAFPVLAVHDEIVVECDQEQADPAAAWLKQAMRDGMEDLIAPVPVEVELKAGRTWGG